MDPVIRPANAADLPFLTAHDRHITPEELAESIRRGRILLLCVQGEPAGWLRWSLFWDNTPFMNLLYVLCGHRGQGHGRALVRHWEAHMQARGYTTVLTSTQADEQAQHFYRRLGYRDIGGFVLDGEPMELMMSRALGT